MGMPGSETALEELLCRVLGELLQEGIVAKIADDMYVGGDDFAELLHNWRRVLAALGASQLSLSAPKTIVGPRSALILGWIWRLGTFQASPHRITTLAQCSPPSTVRGLRSFVGAFKVLARVIPQCAKYMAPLEDAIAGHSPGDKLSWSDDHQIAFTAAKNALGKCQAIALPHSSDQLWIVTDAAVRDPGIGATLYISRNDQAHIAGFFSAKLRKHQVSWLPCEVEALCIAASVKHFSPYIIQSSKRTAVLTDSKPCVQAYEKLCRGEFSASPRVSTFLSTASRFQTTIRHVSGAANALSDFSSRNAPECQEPNCQVCTFIQRTEESVVRTASIQDIVQGVAKLPFTSRPAWLAIQSECPDVRRTHAHLRQGTRPSRKLTNIRDVKRYLNVASIGRDGLVVVRRDQPLAATRECIIVPRLVLDGLLTALHLKLSHPTKYQLKAVINRYFYALDLDQAIQRTTDACHHCAALLTSPKHKVEQSSEDPPDALGVTFAADVIRRARQMIFILRECVTSYTVACFITSETQASLREALISLCLPILPRGGPQAVIRTDPAPGFAALVDDVELKSHRIHIELGRTKNPNKNPVGERAVQELEHELLRVDPSGAPVSLTQLSLASSNLNARIRDRGLSAREMWTQRDQFNNDQIPISDRHLIMEQSHTRSKNHPHSEISKAPSSQRAPSPSVSVGDLVYLYCDGSKGKARDRYLVTSVDGPWCNIRKFAGQQLRCTSYRVKRSECYCVPTTVPLYSHQTQAGPMTQVSDEDVEDDYPDLTPSSVLQGGPSVDIVPDPPRPPDIPIVISQPVPQHVSGPSLPTSDKLPGPLPPTIPDRPHYTGDMPETPSDYVSRPGPMESLAGTSPLRRSTRDRKPPDRFKDYVCD